MKRTDKNRRTKRGASSLFLAVIMSALILVECTFVAFVWNLDYALSVNEALKTQVDTILCDYNRQLFDVYGIYAFTLDEVDDECFCKALEMNGLTSQSTLVVTAADEFTTEDLKTAINSYYWYRGTGISLKGLVEGYAEMLRQTDESGILNKVGEYMQSPAAGYVSDMIKGSEDASQWIGKAGEALNLDEILEQAADLDDIRADYKDTVKDIELDIDIDIDDWEALLDTLSFLESTMDNLTDMSDPVMTKMNVSHYCAYNFDCCFAPDGDASITGTEFSSIHGDKQVDAEYIITGLEDYPAIFKVEYLMVQVLIVSNMLKDYANEEFRNTMEVLGQIISTIISAVSEGTVNIDYRIIAAGLTYICASFQSIKDFYQVIKGQRAVIFEYEGEKMVTFSYRDFLYLFALCTPVEELLERSHAVLERDYGELYKGITLEADFRGDAYSVTKSYQLYEK
ncbi:MAG: hypothetical protein E7383_05955 [Ruminococcaceae bacterium]|nr:hypothetical protein [Oscillospiraceae bacterium]